MGEGYLGYCTKEQHQAMNMWRRYHISNTPTESLAGQVCRFNAARRMKAMQIFLKAYCLQSNGFMKEVDKYQAQSADALLTKMIHWTNLGYYIQVFQ